MLGVRTRNLSPFYNRCLATLGPGQKNRGIGSHIYKLKKPIWDLGLKIELSIGGGGGGGNREAVLGEAGSREAVLGVRLYNNASYYAITPHIMSALTIQYSLSRI